MSKITAIRMVSWGMADPDDTTIRKLLYVELKEAGYRLRSKKQTVFHNGKMLDTVWLLYSSAIKKSYGRQLYAGSLTEVCTHAVKLIEERDNA